MVRLHGRRLVRAIGLGLLVLLLMGSMTGIAAANEAAVEDGAMLAAPRPGDRAEYVLAERVFDGAAADDDLHLPDAWLTAEWRGEAATVTAEGGVTMGRSLQAEMRWDAGNEQDSYPFQLALYDGADGSAVARQSSVEDAYSYDAVPLVQGLPVDQQVDGSLQVTVQLFEGAIGPCGFAHDHWGRVAHVGDAVQVYGGCDRETGRAGTTFHVTGWGEVQGRKTLHLEAPGQDEGSLLELDLDPDQAMPLRIVARFPQAMYQPFLVGREFVAERIDVTAGAGDYQVPAKAIPSPLLPLPAAKRTPWMLDDSGVVHAFPLRDAYAYATDATTYLAETNGASVPQFLGRYPDAYLAYAWNAHAADASGAPAESWGLVWAAGDGSTTHIAKMVTQRGPSELAAVPMLTPNMPVGREAADWEPYAEEDQVPSFPPAYRLPSAVPSATEALALADVMLSPFGMPPANVYGFGALCFDLECTIVHVIVYAGNTDGSASEVDALLRDQQTRMMAVGVMEDGVPLVALTGVMSQDAPVSVLPPSAQTPDVATAPSATEASVWAMPSNPAVASLSFLALVASALYYFWPALKGSLGAGLFSRIDDGKVLEHPTRRRIHDAIASEPGIHFQALSRKADVGRGALEHHLRKLLAAEVVTMRRAPGFTCYFLKGSTDRHMLDAAPSLRSDGSRAVLKAVAANPGVSSRDLAASLGISPSTASYHLKRLETAGLVAPGEKSGVRVTPLGSQAAA